MSPFHLFGGIGLGASAILLVWLSVATDWPLVLVWPLVLTPITFLFYWFDKRQARRGGLRVPEIVLLLLALVGGFVGGLLAMLVVRHKTLHLRFWVAQGAGVVLYGALLWWLFPPGG
jgi:uncharacterized membrane protein YsdA (DUF1294 family)